jgi:hypothetical protein
MIPDSTTMALADELAAVAKPIGVGSPVSYPRHFLEVWATFDRCRSFFGAICLLARHDFGEEAVVLARSLFGDSLMLMELAAVDEARQIEIVAGFLMTTLNSQQGIAREAQRRGEDASDDLARIQGQRADLEDYARRHGVSARSWKLNEKDLATKYKREYLDFRVAHLFVHGSAFAAAQRYSEEGDDVWIGRPSTSDWATAAVLFAASSLVCAIEAVCTIVGWPQPEELADLRSRIERASEQLVVEDAAE